MQQVQMDVSVDYDELYQDLADLAQQALDRACDWGYSADSGFECPLMQNRAEVLYSRYEQEHRNWCKARSNVFFLANPIPEEALQADDITFVPRWDDDEEIPF